MNKADLKQKWSQYCDTDKLVDDMMALLTKYHHKNTERGVCSILEEYFTQKQSLIELFKKSSRYIGDMRIAFDVNIENYTKANEIQNFCIDFCRNIDARSHLVKKVDEHGKCRADYVKTGMTHISARDLLDSEFTKRFDNRSNSINKFNSYGKLMESVQHYEDISCIIGWNFAKHISSTVSPDIIAEAAKMHKPVSLAEGMKTSRAFNKVCTAYGLDKANPRKVQNTDGTEKTVYPYDKLFAQYADMVTDHKRKLKFFISVNPLDYLTMSFGVSWNSCHDIDKTNVRQLRNRRYSGSHCAGVMSYLLDGSSIITYVHQEMPESFEEGKIYRNMFHFENDLLVQGRVYPQGNDGCTDLYKEFREIVQNELAKLLELQNNEWKTCEESIRHYAVSNGLHYKDYNTNSSCNITYPVEKKSALNNEIHIGHDHICPYCGTSSITYAGSLVCNNCR